MLPLLGGELIVEDEGDEQSSEADRLRLNVMVGLSRFVALPYKLSGVCDAN